MNPILIYGGSFDPPHLGHLYTAIAVQQYFHFHQVMFLPCKTPALKAATQCSAMDRLHMLERMIKDNPEFSISTLEIDRDTPSYMSNTLNTLRAQVGPNESITLLLGMDTFLSLGQWHQCEKIPKLCNLLVIQRQGVVSAQKGAQDDLKDILKQPYGKLVYFDAGQYAISSTDIRKKIQSKADVSDVLSAEVEQYIRLHGLYQ